MNEIQKFTKGPSSG